MILIFFLLSIAKICICFDDEFLAKIGDVENAELIAKLNGFEIERKLQSYDDLFICRQRHHRKKRAIEDEIVEQLMLSQQIELIEKLRKFRRCKRKAFMAGKLPTHVWNLQPSMRIREAWKAGFNATQVTVAIVDDGVDVEHVDLRHSFTPDVSFDFVNFANLPVPRRKSKDSQHGTQCAGLVSMMGHQCGLGVGHGANLGGIRLLGSELLDDALEGDALAFKKDHIDVYSISWGPRDDGTSAEKPQKFTADAIEFGARKGRRGLGNVFVWASGNGGRNGDNCALDGYVNNEYTLSFGVVNADGSSASYAEGCSAVIAAVSGGDAAIATTGFNQTCASISGSSAGAAIAAGVIALAIQANPSMSQRDIQHLIAIASNPDAIRNVEWHRNGAGYRFNSHVGFGLLDAEKMVRLAKHWVGIGPELACREDLVQTNITAFHSIELGVPFNGCSVGHIERVVVAMSLIHSRRGQLSVWLRSPTGTVSRLLAPRPLDDQANLLNWQFVSTHFFGESPEGDWSVLVSSETPLQFRVENLSLKVAGSRIYK
ncbi:unnamed protein product [Caenorhabditis bovis]|uniref:P/Homo B domain-containing protein n=1 Tax=Caenorhabditis bovis TaxID=2654633 RepID=A0A8S1F3R6_9PELO|nr:unnamed protein product [Caenorhabditis bovis]